MPETRRPNPPARASDDAGVRAGKAELRAAIRGARRSPEPAGARRARTQQALTLSLPHEVIALYGSVRNEPDTWSLIDALAGAGRTLLLPVLGRREDGTVRRHPDWAPFAGRDALRAGYAGIAEPTTPPLGADALAEASLIWCAALAATPAGDRLGTGGGWYDRALAHAASQAVRGVLLRDDEVLDRLPVESFDRRIDLIVTPVRTLRTVRAPE
ncbi:MAG: 5-formyltetrahydrofolate cyclo-ligase [Micropruina sp.]|nr:5-formyltetrahydrofolate cyclo-ligase [Micropruina sp.]